MALGERAPTLDSRLLCRRYSNDQEATRDGCQRWRYSHVSTDIRAGLRAVVANVPFIDARCKEIGLQGLLCRSPNCGIAHRSGATQGKLHSAAAPVGPLLPPLGF